jgi:hypothetical protein
LKFPTKLRGFRAIEGIMTAFLSISEILGWAMVPKAVGAAVHQQTIASFPQQSQDVAKAK